MGSGVYRRMGDYVHQLTSTGSSNSRILKEEQKVKMATIKKNYNTVRKETPKVWTNLIHRTIIGALFIVTVFAGLTAAHKVNPYEMSEVMLRVIIGSACLIFLIALGLLVKDLDK